MGQSEAEKRIVDGRAWHDFCDALKSAGDSILRASTPTTPFDRAEGWRYLTRLMRAALEMNIEHGDPRFPAFYQLSNETIKIGNDNPDNLYHNCNISGAYEYRIRGTRGSVHYISFGTKCGGYASDGTMRPSGQLNIDEMQVEPDGSFEILVSCEKQPGNWLPMEPDTSMLIVRQTFLDRGAEEPAQYEIERIGSDDAPRIDPETFEQTLQASAAFVAGTANKFVDWMERYESHLNGLPSDDQEECQRAGGDAAIHYKQSYWKLGPDEALVIEAKTIPECSTWNLQLSNFWMESLDYLHHRIHINKHSAHYEPDGSVRIVVAHRDPGPAWPNWLTTDGHGCGGMLFRWIEATDHPPVETRVVKHDELAHL
jgi:hypothetical protein